MPGWESLTRWAQRDLSLARLAEGHTDAVAILAELGAAGAGDLTTARSVGGVGGAGQPRAGGAPGAGRLAPVRGEAVLRGRPGV